jgi:probable phosphoglycerate mutase
MDGLPEIYVLRHGETVWNAEGRFQGERDSALTVRGEAQARAMGEALAALGVTGRSHRWIASPMGRAVRTAELARGGMPDALDPRLAEIGMGRWAGLTRAEIDAGWPGPAGEAMMAFYARVPEGEGFAALAARVRAVLAGVTGPAVMVTHGMTSRFLRGAVLGLPPEALGDLPGGHGVVFRCVGGRVEEAARVDGLPEPRADGIAAV